MKEQLVGFEVAKRAKEKGFDWDNNELSDRVFYGDYGSYRVLECPMLTSTDTPEKIKQPTQALLQKWLREVHKLHFHIYHSWKGFWGIDIYEIGSELGYAAGLRTTPNQYTDFKNYEEALEEGLLRGLELLPDIG